MKKSVRKALLWIVALIVLLPIAFYMAAVGINRKDRPPSPASVRLQEIVRALPPVGNKENAYMYILGFSAVKDADPAEVGRRRGAWLDAQRALREGQQRYSFPDPSRLMLREQDAGIKRLFDQCRKVDASCVAALDNVAVHRPRLAREEWLRERYALLLAHNAFREAPLYDPALPSLPFVHVLEGQKLHMLQAWTRSGLGDAAGVKSLLASDLRFWRMVLTESDSLVTKMVAAHAVAQNFAWTNVVLRRLPAGRLADAIPSQLSDPISLAERSMLRPFAGESHHAASAVRDVKKRFDEQRLPGSSHGAADRLNARLVAPFFQLQDTLNVQAQFLVDLDQRMAVDYGALPAVARTYRQTGTQTGPILPRSFYNPLGRALAAAGRGQFERYGERVADLEGQRRATLLAARLHLKGVDASAMPQALDSAPLRDPYTGNPFGWDAKTHSIVFQGLEEGPRGRYSFYY